MMNANNHLNKTLTAACPACGLLCDDVLVENNQDQLQVKKTVCAKSIHFFEQPIGDIRPKVQGNPVTLQEAITHAAKLLGRAKKTLFSGMSTDVQGFRAAFGLAQKTKATIRHINAKSSVRNTKVMQAAGWYTTTLAEVKNRAEVIVCIGTDIVSHNPRFFERFVWVKDSMFTKPDDRKIIYIGEKLDTQAGVSPNGRQPELLQCTPIQLPEVVTTLRALILGKKVNAGEAGGIALTELQALADTLKQSPYSVLAWCAKDLDYTHAELTIQNITETVNALNQTTRAAGLHLGGSDGDTSVNYTNAWLTSLTLNDQDTPHDLSVWINSFSPDKSPEAADPPSIVFGNANLQFSTVPEVFIPVATPGLDCSGTLFRVDGSIALPLRKTRETQVPTLTEVLQQIEELLA